MNGALKGRKIALLSLGCKVNSYETDCMRELLINAGADVIAFENKADIYIVNTCTVTNIADRKSRQMLHRAKTLNPDAIVAAVGCYVQAAGDELLADKAVDIVIGNNHKNDIVEILADYFSKNCKTALTSMLHEKKYESMKLAVCGNEDMGHSLERTRAYIKIQDGCNQFCSYCIIPYCRGRIRSRAEADIISEVMGLVENGYKEIVLTGIHLSSYGMERDAENENEYNSFAAAHTNHALLLLIQQLCEIKGLERIRFGSLEPRIITEEFVNALAEEKKVCPHFHLSLQSGCNETLKRMNRKYSADEYYEKCCIIRKYYERPAITTDIIVGFPGETAEEFAESCSFVKKVAFSQLHVFKYSRRKGTKAERMPGQVRDEVKSERSDIMLDIGEKLHQEYIMGFIGSGERVLVEQDGYGHTERYVKVYVADEVMENELVHVSITGIDSAGVLCGRVNELEV